MEFQAKKKDEKKEEDKKEKGKGKKKQFPFWLGKKKKAELLTSLTTLADTLDSKGLKQEADILDNVVQEVANDPNEKLIAQIMALVNEWESADKSELIQDLLPLLSTEQLQTILTQQNQPISG